MPLPVVIISGFLGCGKTSFLRKLLPFCGEEGIRPTLVINEVGEIDVDGESVADLYSEQVKLVGGCICCTLQSQLTETVFDILEKGGSELLIIECSGLSNPLDVVEALSKPALIEKIGISHIVSMIDVGKVERVLKAVDLAQSQISTADIVILNKTDMANPDEISRGCEIIADIAPNARVFEASYGDIGEDMLRSIVTDQAPARCSCGCGHNHDDNDGHNHDHSHDHSHSLPASFCSAAFRLPAKITRHKMERILVSLPENVIRAKGFADLEEDGWVILHKVFENCLMMPLKGPEPNAGAVLICIGRHLSVAEIDAIMRQNV